MGQSLTDLEARQVKCLTADAGHIWMPNYDRLPPAVRRRLADSPFNICAACMDIEAHRTIRTGRKPSLAAYFAAIETIETQLKAAEEGI
jgi:hypothetical protein